jgi:hypothetical protein
MANPVIISIKSNFRARDNPSAYYYVDDKYGVIKEPRERSYDSR